MNRSVAGAPIGSPDDGEHRPLHISIGWQPIWKIIAAVLITLAGLWAANQMRSLISMLIVSFFFSLALQPAVNWLVARYKWRRGAAVGVIFLAGFLFIVTLIVVLIPAVTKIAGDIGSRGGDWFKGVNDWLGQKLNVDLAATGAGGQLADESQTALTNWSNGVLSRVAGAASSGLGYVFKMATVAMFTFYLTADAPRLQKTVLSHMSPQMQQRVGWTWDEAIKQTGGYFYSRALLMLINGIGFLFTMVVVGMPITFAIPLAVFAGFVSEFIPAVGTYIGGAAPAALTFVLRGWVPALIVLAYVLVYQQIENYWLGPRISARTMSINGAVAFGAALAGGALAGPMGAFMALPIAALIISLSSNFSKSYEVVYRANGVDELAAEGAE